MIRTEIGDVREYASGWVAEYLEVVRGARYPAPFHLLAGMWALGAILGDRGRVYRQSHWTLPIIHAFLVGESGIGKSSAMKLALEVLEGAKAVDPTLFSHSMESFTRRGFLLWVERAMRTPEGLAPGLWGGFGCNEATTIFRSRTGTETNKQFMIHVLDHETIREATAAHGIKEIIGLKLGVLLCSTLADMRECMTERDFQTGLLPRFLLVVADRKGSQPQSDVDIDALRALGATAVALRDAAPEVGRLSAEASDWLRRADNVYEERAVEEPTMAGVWNRLPANALRVALQSALGDARASVEVSDLTRAERLLGALYHAASPLAEQLGYNSYKARVFTVLDELEARGHDGMTHDELCRRLPAVGRATGEMLAWLKSSGLAFVNAEGTHWWRAAGFAHTERIPNENAEPEAEDLALD